MYTVYVIHNKVHDKIYIGQTKDLTERMRMHNEHLLKGFTSRFSGEWFVVYREEVESRQQALIKEKQLKSFRGREFIRKFIPV